MPTLADEPDVSPGGLPTPPDRFGGRALALLLICFALTAASGLFSEGVHHADDLRHFLFARWACHDARYLIDAWGRPGFTALYALPAQIGSERIGWHACRLLSAALSAATAFLAYRIARHYRLRHAWLAIPLVYVQPLFTRLSLTTLTETPLAFYLALATWLLLKRRPLASAAVIALAPITRHEAIVLLPLWAIALWRSRARWQAYPLMIWAIVLNNLLAAALMQSLPIQAFFRGEPGDLLYGQGTPLTFVPRLLLAAGPLVTILAIPGAKRVIHRTDGWLMTAIPALYFITETALYLRGAYVSGGYPRFLVPIAPHLAVLAAAGIRPLLLGVRPQSGVAPASRRCGLGVSGCTLTRRVVIRDRAIVACGSLLIALWVLCEIEWWWRPPTVAARWQLAASIGRIAAACFLPVLAAALWHIRRRGWTAHSRSYRRFATVTTAALLLALPLWAILPLRPLPQQQIMRDAAAWLDEPLWRDRPLVALNPWLYYWADRLLPYDHLDWRRVLAEAEPGTLFAWDADRCPHPGCPGSDLSYADMLEDPTWRVAWTSEPADGTDTPFLVLFERTSPPATQPVASSLSCE